MLRMADGLPTRQETFDSDTEELLSFGHHFDQAIHFGFGFIEVKTRTRRGLDAHLKISQVRVWQRLTSLIGPTSALNRP